jgi:transposase
MKTQIYKKSGHELVNFTGKTIYIGIDTHKKNWNVSIFLDDMFVRRFHQEADSKALHSFLTKHYPEARYVACYEAGFKGFSIYRELSELGIECEIAHAADLPQTNKDKLNKNDKIDSRRLGEALSKKMINSIYILNKQAEADRTLVRYRRKIKGFLKSRKTAIKSFLFRFGIDIPPEFDKSNISKKYISWLRSLTFDEPSANYTLQSMVDDVECLRKKEYEHIKQIRALAASDRYRDVYNELNKIPGIGLIAIMTLLTEVVDINRFYSFKKLNSYVGMCPTEFSSGEKIKHGKITPRANKGVRTVLIEAAWTAVKYDPALSLKFSELRKRMESNEAIVSIARKLLSRIYAVWKNHIDYKIGVR